MILTVLKVLLEPEQCSDKKHPIQESKSEEIHCRLQTSIYFTVLYHIASQAANKSMRLFDN